MKWFGIVINMQPDLDKKADSQYGYALCAFKLGRPALAIEFLDKAIYQLNNMDITEQFPPEDDSEGGNSSNRNAKKDVPPPRFGKVYFRYLRALSHRLLGNFQKSQ